MIWLSKPTVPMNTNRRAHPRIRPKSKPPSTVGDQAKLGHLETKLKSLQEYKDPHLKTTTIQFP